MNANKLQPLILRPDEALVHNYPTGEKITVLLASEDTGGAFAFLHGVFPPGTGAPLHVHRREDEMMYVLEGTLDVQIKGTRITLTAGESVFLPRDIPHAFSNLSKQPVKAIAVAAPGGFEAYFADMMQLFADGEPELTAVNALGNKYGVENVGPPLTAEPNKNGQQ